jgi:mono/diheme cytochrome c family protein
MPGFGLAMCTVVLLIAARPVGAAGDAARGRVVFALAGGCGCHTSRDGPVGAGGGQVPTPFGTFYGTNLTPDPDMGLGRWSDAEVEAAIRGGIARGKGVESPAMPYYQYAGMADQDVADLIAYLRSLPPVARPNRPHSGELPLGRWAYRTWRWLFVHPRTPPRMAPADGADRGRYLVNHVSICGDCHTPRNWFGVPDAARYLAGAAHGPGGEPVPNITSHATGIGEWSVDDVVSLLTTGMQPNFDNVQGLMADVIDGTGGGPGYKHAPERDIRAIAEYVTAVPPIDNAVEAK